MIRIEALKYRHGFVLHELVPDRHSLVLSDIALGVWKPHAVARDFLQQLMPQRSASSPRFEKSPEAFGDLVGHLIDIETSGNLQVITAYNYALAVARIANSNGAYLFLVTGPKSLDLWDKNSIDFLTFLAAHLHIGRIIIVVPHESVVPNELPVSWIGVVGEVPGKVNERCATAACSIPGLLDCEIVAALGSLEQLDLNELLPLCDGSLAVNPAARFGGSECSENLDRLTERLPDRHWLAAFVLSRGPQRQGAAPEIYRFASEAFSEGDWELGLRLLKVAKEYSENDLQRCIIESQLQGLRIAASRFVDGLDMEAPPASVPGILRGFLIQSKAWCLVMSGKAAEADMLFKEALPLLETTPPSRAYLYSLNIYALACVRLNRLEEALALERRIENEILVNCADDYHLIYINSLNTARLMRRLGHYEAAEQYYRRAFDTSLGSRSESDFVFKNVCEGFLADLRGEEEISCNAWMRAACHWLAMEVPQSLAPRVVRLITDAPFQPQFVDRVSDVICSRLCTAATRMGIPIDNRESANNHIPQFVYRAVVNGTGATTAAAIGKAGWGLLAVPEGDANPEESTYRQLLATTVLRIVEHFIPRWNSKDSWRFIVDHQFGKELPTSYAELFAVATKIPEATIYWADDEPLRVGPDLRNQLRAASSIRVGSAVKSLRLWKEKAPHVVFKRYRPPRLLSHAEVNFLAAFGNDLRVELPVEGHSQEMTVQKLTEDRVLEIVVANSFQVRP